MLARTKDPVRTSNHDLLWSTLQRMIETRAADQYQRERRGAMALEVLR